MSRFGRYGVIITSVKSRRSRTKIAPRKKGERRSRSTMIHFVILISRQGNVRLTKWYSPYQQKERSTVIRELSGLIPTRGPKLCNFVEWKGDTKLCTEDMPAYTSAYALIQMTTNWKFLRLFIILWRY
ncbi:unnamed protein product [Musa acuminata var. zebrina]